MHIFTIPGKLPGLNEYIDAERSSRYKGAEMKKNTESIIASYIEQQLRGIHITCPVTMHYTWYEPSRRRDLDNISSFGRKCIQDALVRARVLAGDGWRHIKGFTDSFDVDPKNPRVEIIFEEVHNGP